MMLAWSAVTLAIATLLICCNGELNQGQEIKVGDQRIGDYDTTDHKPSAVGDSPFHHEFRELRRLPYFTGRKYEHGSPYEETHISSVRPSYEYGYYRRGLSKRNFDEIDRSNFNQLGKKRNFDEIDLTLMPFPIRQFNHL